MKAHTELLKRLVEINSGTRNVDGVNQVQEVVQGELEALGFQTELRLNPEGHFKSGELLTGLRPVGAQAPLLTLVTHADTVFETSSGFLDFVLSDDQSRAVGPGVIDDKGGIVVALEGLRIFLARVPKPAFSVRFVCSPNEEIGSPGWHEVFKSFSEDSSMILGFEPSLEDGSIVESRRGNRWYHIQVEGREAHAGRAHHEGVNAAHELSIHLDRLQRLTDYEREVTVSIGHISGGKDKFNIVCGHAEAKIDARFPDFPSRNRLQADVDQILGKSNIGAQTSYVIADDCPPFSTTERSKPFLEKYKAILSQAEGRSIGSVRSGGAADANYMSKEGLVILDGLGPTGGKLHTSEEFITLASIESRAQAFADFLDFVHHQESPSP